MKFRRTGKIAHAHQHHPHRGSGVVGLAAQGSAPIAHGGGFKLHDRQKIEFHGYQ
jgi:hypothetical protein